MKAREEFYQMINELQRTGKISERQWLTLANSATEWANNARQEMIDEFKNISNELA